MSDVPINPEIVDIHDALRDLRLLSAGIVITGFEAIIQVDGLVSEINDLIHPTRTYRPPAEPEIERLLKFKSVNDRNLQLAGGNNGTRLVSYTVYPKTFTGTIVDIKILMLQDGSEVEKSGSADLVLSGCYKSSGKPKEPSFFTLLTVSTFLNERYRSTRNSLVCKKFGKKLSPADTMSAVLEQSRVTAHAVVANGLQHIFAGGLPDGGKK